MIRQADIAPMQGIVSMLYATKQYAPNGEIVCSIPAGSSISSVVITVSLATTPDIAATVYCQPQPPSSNPNGVNIGPTNLPI